MEHAPPHLVIRVIYEDLPDLIQIQTHLASDEWRGMACAYTSPVDLAEEADRVAKWTRILEGESILEAGADTGIGWLHLTFRRTDRAGHVACRVVMVTGQDELFESRLSVAMRTEAGLVERFARELRSLAETRKGHACLQLLPI